MRNINKQNINKMKFDLPKDNSSIIKVIGVGGGGSNAVNHMYRQGIKGVDFIVCNTDQQALDISPVPIKIQLGASLTEGRGAGSLPEVGKNAAIENLDEIREILESGTKMVFVTAGMGGGTGTGAAPVIAKVAKEMGILTVGIITVPFVFEGRKRRTQAESGIENMRQSVDTLLIINNDKLREMFGNLTLANAFSQADDVLSTAAKGIAEVISVTGSINVDFNDVNTVMKDSGVAIMGSAEAEGDNRAHAAVEKALASPLLNDNQISGAKYVLLNIAYGEKEVLMDEIADITDYIQDEAGSTADVIWGHGYDETLGDKICVTIIATGFNQSPDTGLPAKAPEKVKVALEADRPTMITQPIEKPITSPTQNSIKEEAYNADERKVEEPFLVQKTENPIVENTVEEIPTEKIKHNLEDFSTENEVTAEVTPESISNEFINEADNSFTDELNVEDTTEEEVVATTTEWSFTPAASVDQVEEVEEPAAEVNKTWLEEEKTVNDPSFKEETIVPEKSSDGMVRYMLTDEDDEIVDDFANAQPVLKSNTENPTSNNVVEETPSVEDNAELAKMRLDRIRQTGNKMNTQEGLNDLEKEPAYLRRNIQLDNVKHSSESTVSRFTLGDVKDEEGNDKTGLSGNNSFLHDNVD
jgi:cell division protein FtsZ